MNIEKVIKFARCFDDPADEIKWKNYINSQRHTFESLCGLVEDSKVCDAFKARAIVMLCDIKTNDSGPFPFSIYGLINDETGNASQLIHGYANIGQLNPILHELLVEILTDTVDCIDSTESKSISDYTKNILWISINGYIRQLMTIIPEEKAVNIRLLSQYRYDNNLYWGWYLLMQDQMIPEHWKRLIDESTRRSLANSLNNKNVTELYLANIQTMMKLDIFPYSTQILEEQLEFIWSMKRTFVTSMSLLNKVCGLWMVEPERKIFRDCVFHYVRSEFKVTNKDDLKLAKGLLAFIEASPLMEGCQEIEMVNARNKLQWNIDLYDSPVG